MQLCSFGSLHYLGEKESFGIEDELVDTLTKMMQENDIWEERLHALSKKHEELQLESKDKDALIDNLEDHAVKR